MTEETWEELDARLHREATPERLARAKLISDNQGKLFRATVKGERRVFRAAEHENFGPGWMMAGTDYPKRPHVVSDMELEDIEIIDGAPD